MGTIRVVVADDYFITVEGITARIADDADITIAMVALGYSNLLSYVANNVVNVLLLAADMPYCEQALTTILHEYPQVKVITMTFKITDDYLRLLQLHAPHGSIMKDDAGETMKAAIKQVHQFGFYYTPELEKQLQDYRRMHTHADPLVNVTPRDKEIIGLYKKGNNHQQIADLLGLKKSTVDGHFKNIFSKLGVHNVQQAVNELERRRLI